MRLTRRTFIGSVAATLLALPDSARAEAPDGFTLLEARPGAIPLNPAPAAPTAIWGFGGDVPGPLLRVKHRAGDQGAAGQPAGAADRAALARDADRQ